MNMFCKWCGAQTAPAEQACSRCGRPIPALSDCGGFYDLAPKAPRPAGTGVAPKRETIKPSEPVSAPPKRNGKIPAVLLCVSGAVLAALILLQVAMLAQVSELNGTVQAIAERIEEQRIAENEPEEPDAGEDTGPMDPTENEEHTDSTEPTDHTENEEPIDSAEPTENGETMLPKEPDDIENAD